VVLRRTRRIPIRLPKFALPRANAPLKKKPKKIPNMNVGIGRKFEISFALDPSSKKSIEITKTWLERSRRLLQMVPYLAADFVLKEMRSRIPRTEEFRGYKQALEIGKVMGAPENEPVTAIRLNQLHRKIRKIRPDRNVLYVKSKVHSIKKTKPEIEVLEKFSPWTFDTIPFVPEQSEAEVISRKVSVIEVRIVAKKRKLDKVQWRKELAKAGWRDSKKKQDVKPKRKRKPIPDIVFQVLRMEFGLGKERPFPHWRPAIKLLTRGGIRRIIRQVKGLKRLFTDPSYREWQRWPPRTHGAIRLQEARGYAPFQKKLGIRVS
jgi:hypothetical protein